MALLCEVRTKCRTFTRSLGGDVILLWMLLVWCIGCGHWLNMNSSMGFSLFARFELRSKIMPLGMDNSNDPNKEFRYEYGNAIARTQCRIVGVCERQVCLIASKR